MQELQELLVSIWRAAHARGLTSIPEDLICGLELSGVLGQRLGTLSKGWRQRVWLAQALIHDPAVLILDEPTDGLDPLQKARLHDYLRGIISTKAILMSTHILEEAEILCDRFIVGRERDGRASAIPRVPDFRHIGGGTA